MRAQPIFRLIILGLLYSPSLLATHIRAGEITAQLLSCQQFTYRFTLTGYEDTGSGVELGDGNGELYFGFGDPVPVSKEAFDRQIIMVGEEEVRISTYVFEYTFPAGGTYVVSYRERNRNELILNMSNSIGTAFYIETEIVIDPLFCNSTPVLDSQPVDGAVIGRTFTHNPSAYDPDGDSLSYRMVIPQQDRDEEVFNYSFPDVYDRERGTNPNPLQQDGSTPVFLELDALTGLLTWNAPGNLGEYNVAFVVEEWRKIEGEWFRLGYVTRDMQIIVEDGVNFPPEVQVPQDLCVVAGESLSLPVSARDPDGNQLVFEGFGEPFSQRDQPAVLSPSLTELSTPAEVMFSWTPQCQQVRQRPYQVNIKVTDVPSVPPPLVTYDQWNITVLGPPVENLQARLQDEEVLLRWDRYFCANQAESVQLYRRIGSYPLPDDPCYTGLPEEAGYTLVRTLAPDLVSVQDGRSGDLSPGVTYCYRVVATFPDGSVSVASEEVCVTTPSQAPFITNVSVEATDAADGRITVRWTEPLGEAADLFSAPYSYTLLRGTDVSSPLAVVAEQLTATTYEDQGLNTENNTYYYQVVGFDAEGNIIDTSAVASSVRLAAAAQPAQIEINWQASVPWNNQTPDYPYHYIFRGTANNEALVLLDSVSVTADGFSYTDTTVEASDGEKITYCYRVLTQGRYDASLPIDAPLLNYSQRICVSPFDSVPPCAIATLKLVGDTLDCATQLAGKPCNYADWSNTIAWQVQRESCAADIAGVNVYFASTDTLGLEEYQLVASQVTDTFYVDGPLPMPVGCYRVRVVDQSGNESAWSEPVCQDNCPFFALPNIFTPNEDGVNEYFETLKEPFCPRFVQRVQLYVFNRWGKEVHFYDSGGQPNREVSLRKFWDGRTVEGRRVSPGIYFYRAEVYFSELQPIPRTYKGWVQVMYEDVGTN
ncbi:gliding motility-associated C-terminal domain-containing protein [Tunicatimonas pelagia]|uniref:T9SS type B sorting domain-containing protein n=1 Tax=Tunicatimonas pelagia TaxID=931531 RepID=UPI0026671E60|nr:gliding motility-associated C-terminal domain-containing protein [Tunicatimonas pelagia]WKN43907.1 gliding motility-associated C-terminal domain-containing protein [Tunicatimonas pelagia]